MRRIKIALDCDGLMGDFTSLALGIIEEITGRHYEPVDVTEYDICASLKLSKSETSAFTKVLDTRRGLAASIRPYPQARQGVRRLREVGDIFCVTQPWEPNPWWKSERDSWLALHFGIDVVHHALDKSPYEADLFADDRAKHVDAWLRKWSGRTAALWRTLHNTGESVPWGAHYVSSWDSLYQLALETARGAAPQLAVDGTP